MDHRETDEAWAPEEVKLQHAAAGPRADASSAVAEPRRGVSSRDVLARVPRLDAGEPADPPPATAKRSDGRLLSQKLSTKLLFGGGALLVLTALFPFVFGDSEPKPGTPPAPDADEAPAWDAQASRTANAVPTSASASYESDISFPDLPPAPDFIGAAQVPSTDTPQKTRPGESQGQADAAADDRQIPAAEQQTQTDARGPGARANQMMALGGLGPGSAGIYADQPQAVYQADARANLPARYPARLYPPQKVEPGVARLEGIIEKPSVRTTYDAARSSVH